MSKRNRKKKVKPPWDENLGPGVKYVCPSFEETKGCQSDLNFSGVSIIKHKGSLTTAKRTSFYENFLKGEHDETLYPD